MTIGVASLKNSQHYIEIAQQGNLEADAQKFADEVLEWTGQFITYIPCEYIYEKETPVSNYVVLQAPYHQIFNYDILFLEQMAGLEKY